MDLSLQVLPDIICVSFVYCTNCLSGETKNGQLKIWRILMWADYMIWNQKFVPKCSELFQIVATWIQEKLPRLISHHITFQNHPGLEEFKVKSLHHDALRRGPGSRHQQKSNVMDQGCNPQPPQKIMCRMLESAHPAHPALIFQGSVKAPRPS